MSLTKLGALCKIRNSPRQGLELEKNIFIDLTNVCSIVAMLLYKFLSFPLNLPVLELEPIGARHRETIEMPLAC